jgi:hypothetical protein
MRDYCSRTTTRSDPLYMFFSELRKVLLETGDDEESTVEIIVDGAKMLPQSRSYTWKMKESNHLPRSKSATLPRCCFQNESLAVPKRSVSLDCPGPCIDSEQTEHDDAGKRPPFSLSISEKGAYKTKRDSLDLVGEKHSETRTKTLSEIMLASPTSVFQQGEYSTFSLPSSRGKEHGLGGRDENATEATTEDQLFSEEWWMQLETLLA